MIHILEPHGDDALISCYPLLKRHSSDIEVVTVGESRDSSRLAEHFPGIRTQYAGCYEIPNQIGRAAFMLDFKAWQKHAVVQDPRTPWQWQRDVTEEHNGELWKESRQATQEFMADFLNDLYTHNSHGTRHLILAPIGLLHPYHICLADVVLGALPMYPLLDFGFYSEAPYNSAKWVKALELSHPMIEHRVSLMIGNDGTESDAKEEVFRDVYPSEVKIFRFTRDEVLKNASWLYIPSSWSFTI